MGATKTFQDVLKDFQEVPEVLQGCFRELREVSGALHGSREGFSGVSVTFQKVSHDSQKGPEAIHVIRQCSRGF